MYTANTGNNNHHYFRFPSIVVYRIGYRKPAVYSVDNANLQPSPSYQYNRYFYRKPIQYTRYTIHINYNNNKIYTLYACIN